MTRWKSRWTLAGCMALAVMGAVAVLDAGSRTAEAANSVSPFAGSWSGTWAHVEDEVVGTFDWTISDAGRLEGSFYSITNDWGGTVVGHVDPDGRLVMIGAAPNHEPSTGQCGYAFQGTAVIDGDGKLAASLVLNASPFGQSLAAVLERN